MDIKLSRNCTFCQKKDSLNIPDLKNLCQCLDSFVGDSKTNNTKTAKAVGRQHKLLDKTVVFVRTVEDGVWLLSNDQKLVQSEPKTGHQNLNGK